MELPSIDRPKMPGIMVDTEQKDSNVGDDVLCVFVVCPAMDSLVTKKRVFLVVSGEVVKAMTSKSVDTR